TGRPLEDLVRRIESYLAPEGFTVRMDQPVRNDAGEQIAELDILIEGPVGSSTVRWLIECRDRPASGAAPVSWIEQLVGRRTVHGFDKVFAVSTSGFSPAAKDI